TARRRPDELALVQPARSQPQTHAVVHQDLQTVGALVGKDVGMVRVGSAKGGDHPGQRGVGTRAHVQRSGGQPGRIDTDHRNSSRSIWAHCAAADTGHCIVTVAPARWISTRMRSWLGLACVGAGVTGDATGPGATVGANGNATKAGVLSESCSRLRLCSRSQRCTMFGCRPWLKATPATEAPGSRVRARTDAL